VGNGDTEDRFVWRDARSRWDAWTARRLSLGRVIGEPPRRRESKWPARAQHVDTFRQHREDCLSPFLRWKIVRVFWQQLEHAWLLARPPIVRNDVFEVGLTLGDTRDRSQF